MFELVRAGKIVSEPRQQFALKDAANAHRALQSRATTGATILVP
jgi:NADPH2:quinone reductase